ncbi:MAG: succinyldiaminopimelate transaminase [Actinobacteria bacterium]|nr:succinyldiaminopimelate transaminase [Actinomycetota bacterium]
MALPDFPWDSLAGDRARAADHPGGIVDLSVGTPVDPTPDVLRDALHAAADAPGYPTTHGPDSLREEIASWLRRRRSVEVDPQAILPVIGTKELVAWLPTMLGANGEVGFPELAYPTYEVGALLAGARPVRGDSTLAWGPTGPDLLWLNSPANPSGAVLPEAHLAKVVEWARDRPTVVASDECYAGFEWDAPAPSLLDSAITSGDHTGLLMVHSLSKRSNLAGYRFGFVTGDPQLVAQLLEVSKHAGMIVPAPVQAAAAAAYADDSHAEQQADRYARRRAVLLAAVREAGFTVDHSEAGLYLWLTEGRPSRETVRRLSEIGILVAPGDFYGPAGAAHVRMALTATDERIQAAAERLGNDYRRLPD